jgi:orotate phosphoribosyltransferase
MSDKEMSNNFESALAYLGGYWHYLLDGRTDRRYLAKLTSGKVSDVFVNCTPLTSRPEFLSIYAGYLMEKLLSLLLLYCRNFPDKRKLVPTHFCGAAMGGVTLSYELSRQFNCTSIFVEPQPHGIDPKIIETVLELKRFDIPDRAKVLMVEDVITTGKSTLEMALSLVKVGAIERFELLPYVLCLVNRSGGQHLDLILPNKATYMLEIVSVVDVVAKTWDTLEEAKKTYPNVVEAIRPKGNWDMLMKG